MPWIKDFWSYVTMIPFHECWEWIGGATHNGYGQFRTTSKSLPEHRAHRISWLLANGPIPKNLHILHKCDNRKCVNPGHLFLGTNEDNIKDKCAKRRTRTNFKKQDIENIHLLNSYISHAEISKIYKISRPTITRILNGQIPKHLK